MPDTRLTFGAIITAAWLAALIVGLWTEQYRGVEIVSPVMLIFASYLYGDAILKQRFPARKEDE